MTRQLESLKRKCSWSDLGALALVVALGFSAMGVTAAATLLSRDQEGLQAPHSLDEPEER